VTKKRTPRMATVIGTSRLNAANPTYGVIWVSISSVP
jgi:hypothetical protein